MRHGSGPPATGVEPGRDRTYDTRIKSPTLPLSYWPGSSSQHDPTFPKSTTGLKFCCVNWQKNDKNGRTERVVSHKSKDGAMDMATPWW